MAPRVVARSARGPRRWLALLRAGVLLALRFLALPLHARLLVMLAAASLGEDAALLDLLVEAAQCALERLVLTHSDFCQSRFTSSGRGLRLDVVLAANRLDAHLQGARRTRSGLAEHSRGPGRGQSLADAQTPLPPPYHRALMETLLDLLDRAVARFADRPALALANEDGT